jgi:hypothetical protein
LHYNFHICCTLKEKIAKKRKERTDIRPLAHPVEQDEVARTI